MLPEVSLTPSAAGYLNEMKSIIRRHCRYPPLQLLADCFTTSEILRSDTLAKLQWLTGSNASSRQIAFFEIVLNGCTKMAATPGTPGISSTSMAMHKHCGYSLDCSWYPILME